MNTARSLVTRLPEALTRARLTTLALAAGAALAFGGSFLSATPLATAAGDDPATRADELLAQVEQRAGKADIAEVVKKARQLVNEARADGARPEVARVHGEAALEWAATASDWLTAIEKEAAADDAELALAKAETELNHARALLEETEARRNRAQGLLQQMNAGDGANQPAASPPTATPKTSRGTAPVTPAGDK